MLDLRRFELISRARKRPVAVMPAPAGIQGGGWPPACAGTTILKGRVGRGFTLVACYLSLLIGLSVVSGLANAELLGSISDDTAPKAQPEQAPAGKNDGRRIVYRVICSAEDRDLPDCDRDAIDEAGEAESPASLPTPDLPPDKEDMAEAAAPAALPAATPPARETGAHAKKHSPGKPAKKTQAASKKTAPGKRRHK